MRSLFLSLLPIALLGCSVAPPTLIEQDPDHARLGEGASLGLKLAIAPVAVGNAPEEWPELAPLAAVGSDQLAWAQADYESERVALDARTLQRRLGRVSQWSLGGEHALLASAPRGGSIAPQDLLAQAEAENADLLVQLDLLRTRSRWVERDGAWWWGDLFLFWGLGVLPAVFIADEVYAVELQARLQVVEVRSGRALLRRTFRAGHARALNHPERGWSVGGLLWLHPYTLDDEDLASAADSLMPHARKDLERQVATLLAGELRPRVTPLVPKIRAGGFGPRLQALVVGVNGPGGEWDFTHPTPLQGAGQDARDVAEHLRACGVEPLVLEGKAATRAALEAALRKLGTRLRASDRLLVYFAGYGRTDRAGLPALLIADGPLRLRDLAQAVPAGPRVDFVFDASFGQQAGGRTFPGGAPLARGSLGELVKGRPWRLLCAARPEQTAIERTAPARGLFTQWLLTSAAGVGDSNGDGVFGLREAWQFLARWVPAEAREAGAEQRPCVWGSDRDLPLLPLRPATPKASAPEPLDGAAPGGPSAPASEEPTTPPEGTPTAPAEDGAPSKASESSEDDLLPAAPGKAPSTPR